MVNYCLRTGWEEISGNDHYRFRKVLDDGTVLHTRASRFLSKEIRANLLSKILKDQLRTTREDFDRVI